MVRALTVAALAASFLPTPSAAQCSDADKNALMAWDKSWGEATQRGDAAAIGGFLADNFVAVNLVTTVGKAAIIADAVRNAEQAKANPQAQQTTVPDRYVVSCTPNTATITHRNVTTAASGNAGQPTYSRSVHFLEKRGNKWLAVSNAGSPISEQQQLVYMEMDWNDAARNHDAAWVERNYTAFASDISPQNGGIENKEQAVASARSNKRAIDVLELSELNVRIEGNAAVVTGVNHAKGKDGDGKPFDMRVRFTDTFIKQDGQWRVWATQGTMIK